tara:strand:- start:770 stop:1672 length:903 start_codon:yes stop_codon:yes gene_type:complete
MKFKLNDYINLNSKQFSVKFFNQRLPLIYILFNFFYRLLIVNSKTTDDEISKFHKSGFTNINISLKDEINEFKDRFFLKKQEDKDKKKVHLELNNKDKKILITKIREKLSPFFRKLEIYYNSDCRISDILMWRNYNLQERNNFDEKEHFAEHFHQDSYLMTYSKIFINLMDVTEDDGPTEIVPRENRSAFVKSFNYKDRHNYNFTGDHSLIKKNTGNIGDCFLFSSPQLFHRAGVPKNYRDVIQIILVALPRKFSQELDKIDDVELFNNNYNHFQKYTKPYSIVKVIKLFFIFLRHKING